MEHRLLVQTEGVVAVAVELLRRQTAEVTDARQRNREQAVKELPHAIATKGDVRANRLALTKLELRDGLACLGDLGLLASDLGEVANRALDQLGVTSGLANTHVHDDLGQAGDLHDVVEGELRQQCRGDLRAVTRLQTRLRLGFGCGAHQMSLPVRREMRTLRSAS